MTMDPETILRAVKAEEVRCAGCGAKGMRLTEAVVLNAEDHEIPAMCLPRGPRVPHGPWLPSA